MDIFKDYEVEGQLSIFDLTLPAFKIDKPIRLIELFAGVGSQAMALRDLGADFKHYRVVEFDKYAIASYNAIHGTDFPTMDITQISGDDLGIVDTDKYCYIMTYSFPCQDLSVAGKQKGMQKGSGTRSGLLWEVERLLNEAENLPQVLLMENVPQVHSKANMPDFQKWIDFLESKGYSNYWQDLNAKNYGVAQNRNRCFMVSILGDYTYDFPNPIPLEKTMKDYLEDEVDEKYYLSDKMINFFYKNEQVQKEKGNGFRFNVTDGNVIAKTITTRAGSRMDDNFLKIKEATKQGYKEAYEGDYVNLAYPDSKTRRGRVGKQVAQTLTTSDNMGVVVDKPRKDIKEVDRYCEYCGNKLERKRFNGRLEDFTVFSNRKYCNRECMRKDWVKIGDNHNQTYSNAHTTARKINELILHKEMCELCGSDTNLDIHHIDGNWQNNNLDNLMCLCRSCHTKYERNKDKNELRIRKLTPLEVWRLMGFDDEDFEKAAKVNSNTQLYKQAGNSIVVNVLEEIFKELIK